MVEALQSQKWNQGRASTELATGTVKQNKELEVRDNDTVRELSRTVHERITTHEGLMNDCFAEHVMVPKFNRYDEGDAYYSHADAGLMGGRLRTDLAYTLFLSEGYKGGELCVNDTAIVGGAGQIVVYECWRPHYVNPVLQGSRICAIGWIQSLIRDYTKLEIIRLLHGVLSDIDRTGEEERLYPRLSAVYGKLIRKWIN